MSIKGIDSQLMITRALEFVHDANTQLKSGEKMQSVLAAQGQTNAEHKQNSVGTTEKTQGAELQLENEGGGGSAGYEPQGGRGQEPGVELANEILDEDIGTSTHIIDIKL